MAREISENKAHNGPKESYGPSYYDVQSLAEEIETGSGGVVSFQLRPAHYRRRWLDNQWHVLACLDPKSRGDFDACVAGAYFRGNAGSATLSAAMFAALSNLYEEVASKPYFSDPRDDLP